MLFRFLAGVKALLEIRKYQKSVEPLIKKLPFQRLVKQLSDQVEKGKRWQSSAVQALQEAAEAALVDLFERTVLCAIHAGRTTIMVADMKLARRLGGSENK